MGYVAEGGAFAALELLMLLYDRKKTDKGQVVDVSMADSVLYTRAFIHNGIKGELWNKPRGENLLDSGAPFYRAYRCGDGKYVSVGCLEPKFFYAFVKGLGLSEEKVEELSQNQLDEETWPKMREDFTKILGSKPQKHWESSFKNTDACVAPIVEIQDLANIPHFVNKQSIIKKSQAEGIGNFEIAPSPKLSNHDLSKNVGKKIPKRGEHTREVLGAFGVSEDVVKKVVDENSAVLAKSLIVNSKL